MALNAFNAPRLDHAYRMMAEKARYRPAAPGDGLGGTYLSGDEVKDPKQLAREARDYAERFAAQDDNSDFPIGVSNGSTLVALVYTIEAARNLCGAANDVAARLLKMAADELKSPTKFPE